MFRFFTVYGPWGRPDMALFKFTKSILEEKPIDLFNNGNHTRDFTYIDDIVKGVIDKVASRKLAVTAAAGAAAATGVVDITLPVAICSRGVYHWPE